MILQSVHHANLVK